MLSKPIFMRDVIIEMSFQWQNIDFLKQIIFKENTRQKILSSQIFHNEVLRLFYKEGLKDI